MAVTRHLLPAESVLYNCIYSHYFQNDLRKYYFCMLSMINWGSEILNTVFPKLSIYTSASKMTLVSKVHFHSIPFECLCALGALYNPAKILWGGYVFLFSQKRAASSSYFWIFFWRLPAQSNCHLINLPEDLREGMLSLSPACVTHSIL